MKLLIGIPAYNEEVTIGKVIKSIPKKMKGIARVDVVVIDDGSSDSTGLLAQKSGITVLQHVINRGLGGALKTIMAYARDIKCDILITFDADGQHNCKDIPKLVVPIVNKHADIVIGTRWLTKAHAPQSRKFINKLANIVTYIFFGVSTTDSQSGFRALNKTAISRISLSADGMEVSSEFFKEIKRHNLRFCEVPIKPVYTQYSRAKGQRLSNSINVFFQLLFKLLQ